MFETTFPVIDLVATGNNIRRLRLARGLTVREMQRFFGFEEPRAIYKWQKGECLPTVDNLYALGSLLGVPLEQILIPASAGTCPIVGQQDGSCCPIPFSALIIPPPAANVTEPVVHPRSAQKDLRNERFGGLS